MSAKILCLFLCCATALGFNVDIQSRVVHRGSPNSMFGFTVQAHVDGDQKMVLVGAPEAETHRRFNVTRPGAVFKCEPSAASRCGELIFDKNPNNVDTKNRQIDQKSNQWFGATLSSTGVNGRIVACAPRYVSYVAARLDQRDPVGTCFVASSSSPSSPNDVNEFSPCRTSSHAQRKTGVCQAGFSAALSKDGSRLFMGAPGSWYWQGQLYSQNLDKKAILISTPESNPKYDDSYMGYSTTVGDFAGNGMQAMAVGVPRGSDLRGLVVLYTWDLENIRNISGNQIGAYFGYSLASGDIDGDGFDDVIVGSPMFTKPKSDGYEHGRIYVIYQGSDQAQPFTRSHSRTGEVSKGRFGLSVASLGDINLDGFGDIAVGAPYGGAEGRGVVYIFHGSDQGIAKYYSQAITAEEVSSPPYLETFGFSLSGGVDLDSNLYTDLIVGAYKSDSAVFFRSRPVVKVTAEVRFMGESKLIALTDKKCKLADGTDAVCAVLQYCLTYTGFNVNQQINFRVNIELDSALKTGKRLYLIESHETNYTEHILLSTGAQRCNTFRVYLEEDIRDKLTPLEVAMSYELVTQYSGDVIPPVLDQTKSNVVTDTLNIQKNCGPDNVCIPDLKMEVTSPTMNYVLGSGDNILIDVAVANGAEDAFEAAYYLQVPRGVTYMKMERQDPAWSVEAAPIYCSISNKDASGNSTLKCDLGNPMTSSMSVKFRVFLEVDESTSLTLSQTAVPTINFYMESNSTNPEDRTLYDNTRHLGFKVQIKAHLSIIGASDPPELHYNASNYESGADDLSEDVKLGPQVIHKYNIKNEGPFAVEEAEIYIMWPYQTLTGENLMYMLVQPEWIGDLRCDVARHVNPNNIFVHNAYFSPLKKERDAMSSADLYRGVQITRGGGYYGQESFIDQAASGGRVSASVDRNVENRFSGSQNSGNRQYGNEYSEGSQSGSQYSGGSQSGSQYSGSSQGNRQSGSQYSGSSQSSRQSGNQYSGSSQSGGQYSGNTYQSREQQGGSNQYAGSSERNTGNNEYYENRQGQFSGGRAGGHGYQYGTANTNERGEGFTKEQEEAIRRNIAISVNNAGVAGMTGSQGSYQSGYQGQGGAVRGGSVVKEFNRTVNMDGQGNIISQTESSTEYGTLGREGEAGSSFRNRYGSDSNSRVNQQANSNQYGGSSQYGGSNQYSGSSQHGGSDQGRWSHTYSSGGNAGQGHTWSTEESVNKNLNAGSGSYQRGGNSAVTYVGSEEDEIGGFGAYAAQSPNNQFKFGVADVSGSETQGAHQGTYGRGHAQGGYGASGQSSQSGSGSGSSYSYSSSSQSGYHNEDSRRINTRRRRQEQVDPELKAILEKCQEKYKCEVIRCVTGRLVKGQEVWLALRSRINASVLNEISQKSDVRLSTLAATRVTQLPIVGAANGAPWVQTEAHTLVSPQLEAYSSSSVPLWVIVLAAVVGALLLLLLIFALYKCGFFKRNRPSDHSERQPLNGRDEHL